jgi:hypothetical protein
MCCTKQYSVINTIYSRQEHFSYSIMRGGYDALCVDAIHPTEGKIQVLAS